MPHLAGCWKACSPTSETEEVSGKLGFPQQVLPTQPIRPLSHSVPSVLGLVPPAGLTGSGRAGTASHVRLLPQRLSFSVGRYMFPGTPRYQDLGEGTGNNANTKSLWHPKHTVSLFNKLNFRGIWSQSVEEAKHW